jgi:uncharacterized protein YbcV (DUF1398 family)
MFTEQQIKEAHGKVKTGADFPRYIHEIKQLGLLRYEYLVSNGITVYYGENGHKVKSAARHAPLIVAAASSIVALEHIIAIHQQGQTDFPTFCRQAAEAGVEKWIIDTKKMMCTYYDLGGNEIIAEPIPEVEYVP